MLPKVVGRPLRGGERRKTGLCCCLGRLSPCSAGVWAGEWVGIESSGNTTGCVLQLCFKCILRLGK